MEMLDVIMDGLFTWQTLLGLLVGVLGGMLMGALPGLSSTMAVTLLIPISYGMEPVAALVMLTATYTSAIFGGSITAILIHTPGTPSSAATAMDGYALTLQGRGLEALGMSTISSTVGGIISAIALLLIAPPLARMSLKFSSPEYMFIAIFGLTIIGSLAGESLLHGLATGVIGLALGLIGMEGTLGVSRYTFGVLQLMNGIQLVPALIGLFSMSQAMLQCEKLSKPGGLASGQISKEAAKNIKGHFFLPLKEYPKYIPNMIRSSIIGLLVGIMPGAGGDIGSWVSYNFAKRSSKHPETFGKGELQGVCASEAANNAVTGGALIPLLTLSIPGSGTAAVLLGGLIIHGLTPGASLFEKNAHLIYPILVGFLIANILMGIVGVLIGRKVVKVADVPANVLIPIIIVLSVLGSYAINFSMFDVYVMLAFGFIGYFLRKLNYPTAPIVLALILGPMAENGFQMSLLMAKGSVIKYWAGRPLCWLFVVLSVCSTLLPVIINAAKKKSGIEQAEASSPED